MNTSMHVKTVIFQVTTGIGLNILYVKLCKLYLKFCLCSWGKNFDNTINLGAYNYCKYAKRPFFASHNMCKLTIVKQYISQSHRQLLILSVPNFKLSILFCEEIWLLAKSNYHFKNFVFFSHATRQTWQPKGMPLCP